MILQFWGVRNGNYERNAVVKNQETKKSVDKEFLEIVINGKPTGSEHNCSFRNDVNKRTKSTQPNPSQRYSTQQSEKCVENPKSQKKKSQWEKVSIAVHGSPRKTCTISFCEKVAPSRMLVLQDQEWLQIW